MNRLSPFVASLGTAYQRGSTSPIALLGLRDEPVPSTFMPYLLGFDGGAAPSASPMRWTTLEAIPQPSNPSARVSDRLFNLKVATAEIAMHLETIWRSGLFRQLDDLLDEESWDLADILPSSASFRTFLRLVVELGQPRRPSLGCSDEGNIIASWILDGNRLTIECQSEDRLRWVLVKGEGKHSESAAGTCRLESLVSRLAPYDPGKWFYADGEHSRPRQRSAARQGAPVAEEYRNT